MANSFISDHGYRIIQLFENQKELWLEKIEDKKTPIIRMLLHDLDWSNSMQRDIEFTASNGERVRKQIGRNELNVLNIYVSQFPPVDEYEFRLTKPFVHPEGNKTAISSILLAKGAFDLGLAQISERLGREIHFTVKEDYPEHEVDDVKKATMEYAIKKVKTEKDILFNSKPFFTYALILIQAMMFFWLETHGGSTNNATLTEYGAKVNYLIYDGEWWRFITPVFLHIGFMHLAMNSLALYFLGATVERIFGRTRFLIIYLFAGITGGIASFLFSSTLSAGASGAIYGCFGALLYFGVRFPKLFSRTMGMNLLVVLGINLVFSFSASGIDAASHIGGLIGGFLAAGIVHFPKQKKRLWQICFFITSIGIVWGSLYYGFQTSEKTLYEKSVLNVVQDYVSQGKYNQAYDILVKSKEKLSEPSEKIYFLLSFVEIKKNMLSEAKTHLEKAIKLDSKFDEAYFNLALINMEQHNYEEAKANAEQAVKLKPDNQQYSDLVLEINQHL
ncbi:rhomboid family intramembrane serine protease [Neobacillus jeddahensis]|uniref:rhomboid family intramembrane serine protease n=1 Tax=Neobacillus jeddahensis TaxID=1461580 RepID=UPI0027BA7608|nr:rhomboid family intramembrane serine protease [Neobacillus jeddahensis]